jgi:hypothetical protein
MRLLLWLDCGECLLGNPVGLKNAKNKNEEKTRGKIKIFFISLRVTGRMVFHRAFSPVVFLGRSRASWLYSLS